MQIHLRNRMSFWNIAIRLSCLPWLALATAAIADFPTVYNSEADSNAKPPTPQESLAKLALPPGFKATVFAAEPDVQNPIAMAWDSRGRLWIAENYTYAERTIRFDQHLRDRILIFEDNDHDGRFDKRKSLHRRRAATHQRRSRPRRRLGTLPAATAVLSRSRQRRRARRPGASHARWLQDSDRQLSQLCQRPPLGTRRLVVRPLRRLRSRRNRKARHT